LDAVAPGRSPAQEVGPAPRHALIVAAKQGIETPGRRLHHDYDGCVIDETVVAAIDDVVRTELERARQPGLTLGLTDRDSTLLIRTYGCADLASRQRVTPETLFEIGSIGKTFTAVATLQLVDEGRIDLHAPVTLYLPWFTVQ